MFGVPQLRQLATTAGVMDFPFCAYGERWQKWTKVLVWSCPPLEQLSRSCCPVAGMCPHSGKPHIILEGKGPTGQNRTKEAEPYPRKWCTAFARAVRSFHLAAYSRRLEQLART